MTRVQYKNWKTEVAWLRRMARTCREQAVRFYYSTEGVSDMFATMAQKLSARADSLEKAKGTAQSS